MQKGDLRQFATHNDALRYIKSSKYPATDMAAGLHAV
jgi:hypothetical protein